jgi:hypothetical protein
MTLAQKRPMRRYRPLTIDLYAMHKIKSIEMLRCKIAIASVSV